MPAKKKSALARSKARNGLKYQLHVAKKKSKSKKKKRSKPKDLWAI